METTLEATKTDIIGQEQQNLAQMSNLAMLNIGTVLEEKYKITREIARGGMGIVYEAYNQYTHKRVAIKVILADSATPVQLKRFQKELDAYALLSHPNIITIYDAGVYKNNYPYMIMEYIDGVDICTYVKQQEKSDSKNANGEQQGRDWKLCARLIYETALGLEYIHSQKMIHRDIKPSNIIVRPNGSPVIIDLGIVKFNKAQSYNLTRSREIIGTISYMPIEQALGKRGNIDARTDVYSLGLILYKLLTGQKAYSGKNMMDSFNKIMSYEPPLPREIDSKIPKVLEKITIHATEKQKEKRYATAQEFADALKKYIDDENIQDTDQYAGYKKRIWLHKNEIVACCIVVLLAIVIMIGKQLTNNAKEIASNDTTKQENSPTNKAEAIYKLGKMYEEGRGVPKDLNKALEYYEKSANQGYAEAQNKLGCMYEEGKGVKQDFDKARYWWEKSAEQGSADAQFNLGLIYSEGHGVKQDFDKARYWWEKSANQGDSEAQFSLGVMYANSNGVKQDFAKAVYWWEKSANQKNSEAQFNLGLMYYQGQGVKQDFDKARYWWEKSANQKNSEAQFNLGLMYYQGHGVKQDFDKARYWWEKSANQENAEAQFNLGVMYAQGQGVRQNYAKARKWWEKSANQENAEAQFNLGVMYAQGQGVKQDFAKARYWLEQSAEQDYAPAQQALKKLKLMQEKNNISKQDNVQNDAEEQYQKGEMYYKKQDFAKAFELYEKSANQGNSDAQCKLGIIYYAGKGVKRDFDKALYWYDKAANQGNAKAQYNLGSAYYVRKGEKQDYEKARYWLEKSANQGFAPAQSLLGDIYYHGLEIKQDFAKARYWYEKAANQGDAQAKQALNDLNKLMKKN